MNKEDIDFVKDTRLTIEATKGLNTIEKLTNDLAQTYKTFTPIGSMHRADIEIKSAEIIRAINRIRRSM